MYVLGKISNFGLRIVNYTKIHGKCLLSEQLLRTYISNVSYLYYIHTN